MFTSRNVLRLLVSAWLVVVGVGAALAHGWMAPKEEAARPNPVGMDRGAIARGEATYIEHCAVCHGERVEGLSAAETGLSSDTPDLGKRLLSHTDGDFFWKITNGRGEMPSFQDDLSATQIWEVIHFIRQSAR